MLLAASPPSLKHTLQAKGIWQAAEALEAPLPFGTRLQPGPLHTAGESSLHCLASLILFLNTPSMSHSASLRTGQGRVSASMQKSGIHTHTPRQHFWEGG